MRSTSVGPSIQADLPPTVLPVVRACPQGVMLFVSTKCSQGDRGESRDLMEDSYIPRYASTER